MYTLRTIVHASMKFHNRYQITDFRSAFHKKNYIHTHPIIAWLRVLIKILFSTLTLRCLEY